MSCAGRSCCRAAAALRTTPAAACSRRPSLLRAIASRPGRPDQPGRTQHTRPSQRVAPPVDDERNPADLAAPRAATAKRKRPAAAASSSDAVAARVEQLRDAVAAHNDEYYNVGQSTITDAQYDSLKAELQQLEHDHPDLRVPSSPTQTVGAPPAPPSPPPSSSPARASRLHRHAFPMLSLQRAESLDALSEFLTSTAAALPVLPGLSPPAFSLELKYDGMAISLRYRRGRLYRALTRGDGRTGEDVTANIQQLVANLVHQLDEAARREAAEELEGDDKAAVEALLTEDFEVRGEVVMSKAVYDAFVAKVAALPGRSAVLPRLLPPLRDGPVRTPRNLVVGLLRRQLSELDELGITALPRLHIMCYSLHLPGDSAFEHRQLSSSSPNSPLLFHSRRMQLLQRLSFAVCPRLTTTSSPASVFPALVASITASRSSLPFDVDGVVVKTDFLPFTALLSTTSHHPRSAIALKFQADSAQAEVTAVVMQVGRSGRVVPVAEVAGVLGEREGVVVGGVHVRRVSMHGMAWMREMGVSTGSRVLVERRGDVIPQIAAVVSTDPAESPARRVDLVEQQPQLCPCERRSELQWDDGELYCTTPGCPSQLHRHLLHYCSRPAMNIASLGPSTLQMLLAHSFLDSLTSIPRLCTAEAARALESALQALPGWGERRIDNLLRGVRAAHRAATDEQVLLAVGVRGVGEVMARRLCDTLGGLSSVRAASAADVQRVKGVGNHSAERICTELQQRSELLDVIDTVRSALRAEPDGGQVAPAQGKGGEQQVRSSVLHGMVVVFTGTLSESRAALRRRVEAAGGRVDSAVTKATTHLVRGDMAAASEPPSRKEQAAQAAGISVVDETELRRRMVAPH